MIGKALRRDLGEMALSFETEVVTCVWVGRAGLGKFILRSAVVSIARQRDSLRTKSTSRRRLWAL